MWTFVKGNLILTIVNLIVGVAVTRAIGPAGRGVIAIVGLWPTMMLYWLNLNLPPATSYFFPRMTADRRRTFVGSAFLFAIAVGSIAGVALSLLSPLIFRGEASRYLGLIRILMLLTPLGAITELATNVLLALKDNRYWSYVRLVQPVLTAVGVGLLLIFRRLDVVSLLLLNLISSQIMSAAVWVRVLLRCGIAWPGDWPMFSEILRYAAKSHAANVAGSLNQSLDQLLLGTFLGVRDLGLYSLAVNFTNLISPFVNGASVGVLPQLSSESGADRGPAAVRTVRSAIALICVGVAALLLGAPLIPFIYGGAFAPSVIMALLLLPGTLLRGITAVLSKVVLAYNMPLKASLLEVAGLIVTAVSLAVLLPTMKGYGASIASTLAYTTGFLIALRIVARLIGTSMAGLVHPATIAGTATQALKRKISKLIAAETGISG